jgi:hypothetical protein
VHDRAALGPAATMELPGNGASASSARSRVRVTSMTAPLQLEHWILPLCLLAQLPPTPTTIRTTSTIVVNAKSSWAITMEIGKWRSGASSRAR